MEKQAPPYEEPDLNLSANGLQIAAGHTRRPQQGISAECPIEFGRVRGKREQFGLKLGSRNERTSEIEAMRKRVVPRAGNIGIVHSHYKFVSGSVSVLRHPTAETSCEQDARRIPSWAACDRYGNGGRIKFWNPTVRTTSPASLLVGIQLEDPYSLQLCRLNLELWVLIYSESVSNGLKCSGQ